MNVTIYGSYLMSQRITLIKDHCECCKACSVELELQMIKYTSLISTLQLTVNQLKLQLESYQVEESN